MKNPNSLVSLAYIKSSDNPLEVFCNYILYVLLISPSQSLRADQLQLEVSKHFGLNMKPQMLNMCARILKKDGAITVLPNGAGYAVGKTTFDTSAFENSMRRLHEQEQAVLNTIVEFVSSTYNLSWSIENARNYLSSFLDKEGYGAQLFMYDDIALDEKRVSPSWYIGRFIHHLRKTESGTEKAYLEEIVNGMMIYQGIYQTNDYTQDKSQKFRGTVFYLDTKLILRALGYSWSMQVQASQDLIELITKKYGAKVGVFQQTLAEVENALYRAGKSYDAGKEIFDNELKMYAALNPAGASLLTESSTSVLARLKAEYGIETPPTFNWDSPEVQKYTIEIDAIEDYIKKMRNWRSGSIHNDVEILNQINILRKGDYSVRYGGKAKQPIFITSNADLVYTFRDYISESIESDVSPKWNIHALPVISDNMLLFRLWVPYANEYSSLPALTLARYAYAAQNADTHYFEKLRETAAAYQAETGIELLDLAEIRRQKLEDLLVTKTSGDPELLTEDMIASSIDELVKMESHALNTKISHLEDTVGNQAQALEQRDARIIKLAASPHYNKLGLWRILIWLARLWGVASSAICGLVVAAVEIIASSNISTLWIIVALPATIQAIFSILGAVVDIQNLNNYILKLAISKAWQKYSDKIIAHTGSEEQQYIDDILELCLSNTPIFCKYRKFCTK